MHRRISETTVQTRLASWFRKGYPKAADDRGHCYLLALCGAGHASR